MRFLNKKAAVVIGCLVLALAFAAPPLIKGDEWNLATKFTVNHQFEVPGMVLQPNTPYVIRLMDSSTNRNVVQIFDENQRHMLTMFMAVSTERQEETDETVFTFIETQPNFPIPIKEWFYPGRLIGQEFVYPKEQAMKIAARAKEPVLSTNSNNLHDLASVSVQSVGPIGTTQTPVAQTAANLPVEQPAPAELPSVEEAAEPVAQENVADEPVQIARNDESELKSEPEVLLEKPAEPAVEEPAVSEPAPAELPATAGELPLIALIGVLCLGAGLGFKVLSAKS
jgi:hypothetical protein